MRPTSFDCYPRYTSEAITYSRQRRDAERKALAHKNQYKEYIKKDGVGSTNVEPFSPETQELWKRGKEEKAYGVMKSGRLEKEWLNGLIRLFGKEGGHRGEDQDMPNVVDEEVHPASDEVDHHTRTLRERGKRLRRGPLGGPLVEMQGALQEIAARINEQGSSISNTPIHKDLGDEKGLSTEWTASTERNEVTRRIFSIVRRLEELEEGIEDAERWTTKTLESTKEALIAALDREIGRYMGKIGNKVGESQNMDVEQSDQLAANERDIVLEETRSHRTSLRDSVLTADVYLRLIKGDMRPEQDVDIATGTDKLIANRTQLEVLDTELSMILGGVEKRHQSTREISKEEQSVLLSELMEAQNSAKLSSRIRPDATMAAPMPKLQDIVNQLQDRLTAQWASELQLLEVKAVESVERLNARAQRQQGMLEAEKDRRMGVLE
ncbi:hypothetical protein FRC18_007863 [Serendipita sp. 400]|nr:hypothetical protein FRC18_007863 [Serendipita sp. 400]